jgi:hypothetical protein
MNNRRLRRRTIRHAKPAARFDGQTEIVMTNITEARVIRNYAAMGRPTLAASDTPFLTAREILRAGVHRAAMRREMAAAQSMWDSEGGAPERGTTDGEGE